MGIDVSNALEEKYQELNDLVASYTKCCLSPFVIHYGKDFPKLPNDGLMFIGRATNGVWTKGKGNFMEQFKLASRPEHIQNLQWVEDQFTKRRTYCRKSAFWRVVRSISKELYDSKWYDKIAWSDLYKVAPSSEGNPDKELMSLQKEKCIEILKLELKLLSPKYVVLFTGDWANDFILCLNNNRHTTSIRSIIWGHFRKRKCCARVYKIGDAFFILSEHPQGKNETAHTKCILNIIESLDSENL